MENAHKYGPIKYPNDHRNELWPPPFSSAARAGGAACTGRGLCLGGCESDASREVPPTFQTNSCQDERVRPLTFGPEVYGPLPWRKPDWHRAVSVFLSEAVAQCGDSVEVRRNCHCKGGKLCLFLWTWNISFVVGPQLLVLRACSWPVLRGCSLVDLGESYIWCHGSACDCRQGRFSTHWTLSLALSSILIKVLVACLSHQIYPIIGRRTMIVTTHIVRWGKSLEVWHVYPILSLRRMRTSPDSLLGAPA